MKIQKIISQCRRDFQAIYECEFCGATEKDSGYDDQDFHKEVIPAKICKSCGKKADASYRPLTTKYHEGETL